MGIWVVERLMLVSTARGQPRISTIEPGKFNGRPREWLERRHRFGNINQRLLETWTFGFCNSSSADFFRGIHSLEEIFILFRNNFRERSEEDEVTDRRWRSVQNGTYVFPVINACKLHTNDTNIFSSDRRNLYTTVETAQSIVNAALLSLSRHVFVFEADDTTVRKK